MIIFVGILSVAFLNRSLVSREWIGILFIIIGLGVVGVSDFAADDGAGTSYSRNNVITGDLLVLKVKSSMRKNQTNVFVTIFRLIILAQIITAVQMVYEERYVAGLDIPALQAVGWEGFFGFSILGLLLIPMYFIQVMPPFNNNARGVLEDLPDALVQMKNNYQLIMAIIGTIVSIAFFNFAGISVTKEISATTRMVLDSVRTLVIWVISLALSWQKFHYLQIFGFGGLLFGMCLYNNILILQTYDRVRNAYLQRRDNNDGQNEVIINRRADEPDC